ncbi:MAG: hypothetical protein HYX28_01245 [Candidatus Koribacter versatilis]|uniref:Uncharacterized protein n=1 Tax=Candidatus Korobacter versatilis TaxID=658062 RepID=A0A932A747_9BACT|nr:hypothetical protein [Candidatus Koribacter versatilis]
MARLRLKLDLGGTRGDEAWRALTHFEPLKSAAFGPQFGMGGECRHTAAEPHPKGEWCGALITLETPLLAQYAMSHYLEQPRVLDADVE